MKKRIFVADVDVNHIASVRRAIARVPELEFAGYEEDGRLALQCITTLRPDILLTDIQLPCMDGFSLLREVQRMKDAPVSIVITRFYSDICVGYAFKYGAVYVLYKPIDYNHLSDIILECWQTKRRRAFREETGYPGDKSREAVQFVRGMLLDLGIPSRMSGSLYLTEAVLHLQENRHLLKNLSKGLYAELGAQLRTTPSRIERSLRSAINTAYERGSLRRYFSQRPSNKQFIEFMMESMEKTESKRHPPLSL